MIKALIVEDSGLMRIRLSDVLRSDKDITVVGTAHNGEEGLAAIKEKSPDVVITDMVMPKCDGLHLVKTAMANNPLPIIVLSALDRSDQQIFDALEAGAFAFIDKPRSERGLGFNKPLIELVKSAVNANTDALKTETVKRNNLTHTFHGKLGYDVMVVGASTGGPGAIECLLEGLPGNFPVPVVIAQHMPTRFIESFATRLNSYTNLNVKLAKKGEALTVGHIYICPGDVNTTIVRNSINGLPIFAHSMRKYTEFNEPSIDCLFEGAAATYGDRIIAMVLTGMGKDGTQGLIKIKENGGLSIAQNERSSVVFGMPKAAIDAGLSDYTLDIKEMAGFVTSCFS